MSNGKDHRRAESSARRHAAEWVARRDRGLSATEQDDYLQWLQEDPRHAALVAQHESTVRRMQGLGSWQPAISPEPNPELFAPRQRRRAWLAPVLAAAAAIALGLFFFRPGRVPVEALRLPERASPTHFLRFNEREALADGSLVELRDGSRIEVLFTPTERRVRLIGGEAHFTVAKNPARPFIVEAGGVAVRAVGTAFNVRFDAAAVDVVVTEGRVQVESTVPAAAAAAASPAPVLVAASQRTVVPLVAAPANPKVVAMTPAEVKEVLAWQAPRLQFNETPLDDAIVAFNRHNSQQLVLGEAALGRIPIGGTFRADNVEGFVRLLDVTLDIHGEQNGSHQIVLKRSRAPR